MDGELGVDSAETLESGQCLDGFAGNLLGQTDFIQALKIEPKCGGRAEKMGEAQSGVTRNGSLSLQDLRNAVGGDVQLSRQFTALMPNSRSSSARCSPG